jgi:hypothetical protein
MELVAHLEETEEWQSRTEAYMSTKLPPPGSAEHRDGEHLSRGLMTSRG